MDKAWEEAVTGGDVETVREMLHAGADANALDRYGQTALMLAAHRGYREMVEILVEGGADLDATAKFSLSALMLAVTAGHVDVARVLARAGTDLRIRGSGAPGFAGKTAYDLAVGLSMEDLYTELRPG